MPVLSFRAKLVLAMMLVVAGVSIATLFVTQQRVQANYERMFRRQFDWQIDYFTSAQEARLDVMKEQCLKLSQLVRLISAMNENPIPANILYDTTGDEQERALMGSILQESRLAGLPGGIRLQASLLRFLDAAGNAVPPPEKDRFRFGMGGPRSHLEDKLKAIRGVLGSPERQQVGYLALTIVTNRANPRAKAARKAAPAVEPFDTTNAPTLLEVIVTKMVDPVSEQVVGALVVGFPLRDIVQKLKVETTGGQTNQPEAIQTGVLLEDHLYANPTVIPEPMAAIVADKTSSRILASQKSKGDFECDISNVHYRVFYQLLNQGSAFPPAYQVCLYSMEEARAEQRDLRWKILGSGAVALLGAFLLSFLLSHGLAVPIRELVAGTGEIQRGNFEVKVPVRSRDEIGQLALSFNEMADGLAQKERYRTILNQVADEEVAQKLISGEITLGGELRDVSVLFCDIRGFTPLTQNMPPGEVIEMLNEHMTALTRVVKEHNGVLNNFVGDLLVAIFGAPVPRDNYTHDAAHCALRLIEERTHLNQSSCYKLQIGVGLATGNVVAGGMGSSDRFHYTVLGERVNLASRLCSQATGGEVLIDQNTRERLGESIIVEAASALKLKGFSEPVQAFKLLAIQGIPAGA
jgi:Adenylate cyclase, family 3 (some proteins contain HAMP domain)